MKTTPNLDTIFKLFEPLGLSLTVSMKKFSIVFVATLQMVGNIAPDSSASTADGSGFVADAETSHFIVNQGECYEITVWNRQSGEIVCYEKTAAHRWKMPDVHVRNVNGKCLSDEEMVMYYTGLAKKYGNLTAEYRNAI